MDFKKKIVVDSTHEFDFFHKKGCFVPPLKNEIERNILKKPLKSIQNLSMILSKNIIFTFMIYSVFKS